MSGAISSTAHYQTALSSTFSRSQNDSIGEPSSAPESDSEATNSEDNPRLFVCQHPHCFKAYRQSSGLRYHMKHASVLFIFLKPSFKLRNDLTCFAGSSTGTACPIVHRSTGPRSSAALENEEDATQSSLELVVFRIIPSACVYSHSWVQIDSSFLRKKKADKLYSDDIASCMLSYVMIHDVEGSA